MTFPLGIEKRRSLIRQSSGIKSESTKRRLQNIKWIEGLDRSNLEYGRCVKQILFYETEHKERLLIQFPGKESSPNRANIRPWDFVPKMIKSDGTYLPDFSFIQVWGKLYKNLNRIGLMDNRSLRALSYLFYQMAFLHDSQLTNMEGVNSRIITGASEGSFFQFDYSPLYVYRPDPEILEVLSTTIGFFDEMSLEGFLLLNHLLAWNEDCKYFYRNMHAENGNGVWNGSTGRVNNLLSHLTVIGFILQEIDFASLLGKFVAGRGVAPSTWADVKRICGDVFDYQE